MGGILLTPAYRVKSLVKSQRGDCNDQLNHYVMAHGNNGQRIVLEESHNKAFIDALSWLACCEAPSKTALTKWQVSDFVFQLSAEEAGALRFQTGISNVVGRGGRRYLSYVFTE